MDEPRAQRTLVKSPPELWAEVSDPGALAGHLGAFGDIRITRLDPESTVAWEGDRARGTVELEPSGWGTRVTLTARLEDAPAPEEPAPAPAPQEPEAATAAGGDGPPATRDAEDPPAARDTEPVLAAPPPRRGLLARLFGRRRGEEAAAPADSAGATAEPPETAAALEPRPSETPVEPAPAADAPVTATAPDSGPAPTSPTTDAPATDEHPPTDDEPAPLDAGRAEKVLLGVLDDLGAARHRPYSRG
jgi:hypothetical protein